MKRHLNMYLGYSALVELAQHVSNELTFKRYWRKGCDRLFVASLPFPYSLPQMYIDIVLLPRTVDMAIAKSWANGPACHIPPVREPGGTVQ